VHAREHLERALALYDHDRHSSHAFIYGNDPATSARGCLAEVLWLLGHVDQSRQQSEENVATLRSRVEHPFSVAFGLVVAATLRQFLSDASETRALAEEALSLTERHGLPFIGAMASILRGWALTWDGELEQGLVEMRRGLAAQLGTGANMARPYWLYLIAETCRRTGAPREGLELIDEARSAVEEGCERDWEAEIHRVRGELLLAAREPAPPEVVRLAESSFRRALETARRQGARSLELRAAVSLSRLWQSEGRGSEARELLAPVYARFSEGGLDTPDLREAAAVAAELGLPVHHAPHVTALSGGR
jgi:predicted ATPase